MAKNDNLTDFLTDIADSIREKKGTTAKINPQNFATEIASIEGGGGVMENDLTFYDYDGTILYSYSAEEVEAMTELPAGPQHGGLVFEGWSSTLDEVKTQIADWGKWGVGCFFSTDDNSIRFYITLDREEQLNVTVRIEKGTGTINWGDGAEEDFAFTSSSSITHQYANLGDYVICIKDTAGTGIYFSKSILAQSYLMSFILRKSELSTSVYFTQPSSSSSCLFDNCKNLETITCPNKLLSIPDYGSFSFCQSLKHLCIKAAGGFLSLNNNYNLKTVIVKGKALGSGGWATEASFTNCDVLESVYMLGMVSASDTQCFSSCYNLQRCLINSSGGTFTTYNNTFSNCVSLKRLGYLVKFGNPYSSSEQSMFYNCSKLEDIELADGLIEIVKQVFYGCYSLSKMSIPSSVTTIKQDAFNGCVSIKYYDFSNHSIVPKLENTSAFTGIADECKIVVPFGLYDEWKVANNWNTYDSNIVANYTPEECISFQIEAEGVVGNATTTKIRCTAVINGTNWKGEHVEGVTLGFTVISDAFPKNESTTESVMREVSVTFLGVTATTTFTHRPSVENAMICRYNVTSTSSATQLLYSSFSNYSTYFSGMLIDGEEVPIAKSYKFATTGEHEVIFKVRDGAQITTPYRMFYGITTLTEVDCSALDFSKATSTSSSAGTAYMFYGCTGLKKIVLPESIAYMGYYMFYNCVNVTELTILNPVAPTLYNYTTFGTSSYYIGYPNRSKGSNKFYVPAGATGYDTSYWTSYLQSSSYCGFTKEEI